MTAFDTAWSLLKTGDFFTPIDDLPIPSRAYSETIRLLSVMDQKMGWQPMDWSVTLKSDRDLLLHLETESQNNEYGQKWKEMMQRTLMFYEGLMAETNDMEGLE
jgi:hypothetical protein